MLPWLSAGLVVCGWEPEQPSSLILCFGSLQSIKTDSEIVSVYEPVQSFERHVVTQNGLWQNTSVSENPFK